MESTLLVGSSKLIQTITLQLVQFSNNGFLQSGSLLQLPHTLSTSAPHQPPVLHLQPLRLLLLKSTPAQLTFKQLEFQLLPVSVSAAAVLLLCELEATAFLSLQLPLYFYVRVYQRQLIFFLCSCRCTFMQARGSCVSVSSAADVLTYILKTAAHLFLLLPMYFYVYKR